MVPLAAYTLSRKMYVLYVGSIYRRFYTADRCMVSVKVARGRLLMLCTWCIGGGVTQIVMPYLTEGISHHVPQFQAWRYAFFFPGCMQILWALMILSFGQVCAFRLGIPVFMRPTPVHPRIKLIV